MTTFNSTTFIKSLKERYDAIPFIQGETAAKTMVGKTIKSTNSSPEEVFRFILSTVGISSTLTEAEWKTLIDRAIKDGGPIGENLKKYGDSLKGKLSNEEIFNTVVSCCGGNPEMLKYELVSNQAGWVNIVEKVIKSGVKNNNKKSVEAKGGNKATKKMKRSSVKPSSPKDPRSKSVTLINVNTGEVKTWNSFKSCEIEIGAAHGTVSQIVSGDCKSSKGWKLYKENPIKATAKKADISPKKRMVVQIKIDKRGKEKVVRTFNSITEAAQVTGITHSSISKAATGTYHTAGGDKWRYAECAA